MALPRLRCRFDSGHLLHFVIYPCFSRVFILKLLIRYKLSRQMTVIIFIYNSLQNIYNIIFLKNRNKTVQCQVVLVRPKTSDNWTYNRGSLKTFFYCALIGLSKPLISITLAFKCLNFL